MTQMLHGSRPPEMEVLVPKAELYPALTLEAMLLQSYCFQGPDLLNDCPVPKATVALLMSISYGAGSWGSCGVWIHPHRERGAWKCEQEGELTAVMLPVNSLVCSWKGGLG